MGIIIYIIFGAFVGLAASITIVYNGGLTRDIVVGILGAFIGGFIMNLIGKIGVYGFNIYSFFMAFLGACVLIAIARAISSKKLA